MAELAYKDPEFNKKPEKKVKGPGKKKADIVASDSNDDLEMGQHRMLYNE